MNKLTAIPAQGKIFVTSLMRERSEAGIILDSKQPYLEDQRVLRVGQDVPSYIKVGDIVRIDMLRFAKVKYEANSIQADINGNPVLDYKIPVEKIQNHDIIVLSAFTDIKWVIPVNEQHEEVKEVVNKIKVVEPKILI